MPSKAKAATKTGKTKEELSRVRSLAAKRRWANFRKQGPSAAPLPVSKSHKPQRPQRPQRRAVDKTKLVAAVGGGNLQALVTDVQGIQGPEEGFQMPEGPETAELALYNHDNVRGEIHVQLARLSAIQRRGLFAFLARL